MVIPKSYREFINFIRKYREQLRLSTREVGNSVGCSGEMVRLIEKEIQIPKGDMLVRFCEFYKIDFEAASTACAVEKARRELEANQESRRKHKNG